MVRAAGLGYHARMRTSAYVALLFLVAATLAAAPAAAQPRRPGGGAAAAAAPAPGATPYQVEVQNGIRLIVARDLDGAIAALRQAISIDRSKPDAHYYLGAALRLKNELASAAEAFRACARLAGQANDALFQARGLQGAAETLERIEAQRDAARTEWERVAQWGQSHREINPEVARARMQAIDAAVTQERAYARVRERIAERERERAQEQQQPPRRGGQAPRTP